MHTYLFFSLIIAIVSVFFFRIGIGLVVLIFSLVFPLLLLALFGNVRLSFLFFHPDAEIKLAISLSSF